MPQVQRTVPGFGTCRSTSWSAFVFKVSWTPKLGIRTTFVQPNPAEWNVSLVGSPARSLTLDGEYPLDFAEIVTRCTPSVPTVTPSVTAAGVVVAPAPLTEVAPGEPPLLGSASELVTRS